MMNQPESRYLPPVNVARVATDALKYKVAGQPNPGEFTLTLRAK